MKKLKLYILFITTVLISCNKTLEPDLCKNAIPLKAKISVYELVQNMAPLETDTVGTFDVLFSTPKVEGAKYEWKLGTEIITEREFVRSAFPWFEPLSIKLKVTAPTNACFGNNVQVDSATKNFYRVRPCDTQISGRFRGADLDNPKDTFDIAFVFCTFTGEKLGNELVESNWLYGLMSKDCVTRLAPIYLGYKQANMSGYFYSNMYCYDDRNILNNAWITMKSNEIIHIKYEYYNTSIKGISPEFQKTFTGHRLTN